MCVCLYGVLFPSIHAYNGACVQSAIHGVSRDDSEQRLSILETEVMRRARSNDYVMSYEDPLANASNSQISAGIHMHDI